MTTPDGYQMAVRGRAGVALGISALGSFVAGTFGVIMFMALVSLTAVADNAVKVRLRDFRTSMTAWTSCRSPSASSASPRC